MRAVKDLKKMYTRRVVGAVNGGDRDGKEMDLLKKVSSKNLFTGSTKSTKSTKVVEVSERKSNDAPVPPPQTNSQPMEGEFYKTIQEQRTAHDAIQLKTFTRWWNSWVKPRGIEVNNLCQQIQPGVIGMHLLEAISGPVHIRYNKNPTNQYMELENQVTFINQIKAKGLRLVNIGPSDLQQGNQKLVLGLTWTLILRYEIQKYGADEMELLRWVRETTEGYDGVKITSWSTSFDDGKAFCAILHSFLDTCLDYAAVTKLKAIKVLETAFDVAETIFGVGQLLDAVDMVTGVGRILGGDERSIITYVAKLRQACIALREAQIAAEVEHRAALAREAHYKEVEETKGKSEELMGLADKLRTWCTQKKTGFTGAMASPQLKEGLDPLPLQKRQEELKQFRTEEKPPKAEDKLELAQLYALVVSRIRADVDRAAVTPGLEEISPEAQAEKEVGEMVSSSPAEMQSEWAAMEKAEYDYEDALVGRLAAIELAISIKTTDEMAEPCLKAAEVLSAWTVAQTTDLMSRKDPSKLGETTQDTAKLQRELAAWLSDEKPSRQAEKGRVQDMLREVDVRRAQEDREPLPPLGTQLEQSWGEMEAVADSLDSALAAREKQLARQEAMAATDAMSSEIDATANKWKADVSAEAVKLRQAVEGGDLGTEMSTTERLLEEYRSDLLGKRKPAWAETKTKAEATRGEIERRRQDEGREVKDAWDPSAVEIGELWKEFLNASSAYEQGLLSKLGALKEAEAERLRRAALAENGVASLEELLPPMARRAKTVDDAIAAAAKAAEAAEAELLPWIVETAGVLQNQLPSGGRFRQSMASVAEGKERRRGDRSDDASPAAIAFATSTLTEYAEVGRPPKAASRWELTAAINRAHAAIVAQRYNGTPMSADLAKKDKLAKSKPFSKLLEESSSADKMLSQAEATLYKVTIAWEELEQAEGAVRAELWRLREELEVPSLLWERLRRGCNRVVEWVKTQPGLTKVDVTASSEAEAKGWLLEAQETQAELLVQAAYIQNLLPLAQEITSTHPHFASRTQNAMASTRVVSSKVALMSQRVTSLTEEVARQQQLTAEAVAFRGLVKAVTSTIEQCDEILSFPIDDFDTPAVLRELQEQGASQIAQLSPPPEGATAELKAEAKGLKERWSDMATNLTLRISTMEQRIHAAVKAAPMLSELDKTTALLGSWYTRCTDLLILHPSAGASEDDQPLVMDLDDVKRALEVAESQTTEGDAHSRRITELRRQIDSLGMNSPLPAPTVLEVSEKESAHAISYIKTLATTLRTAVGASPTVCDPAPAIEAMKMLEEGGGGSPLTAAQVTAVLPDSLSTFLVAHLPLGGKTLSSGEKTLDASAFDPFPLDRADKPARPLPDKSIDTFTHGIAVIEHLNRARTDPSGYASALRASMEGCYSDNLVLSAPWGGHYKTVEGETALTDLLTHLVGLEPQPPLKLVEQVCQAAQGLANALGRSEEISAHPLEARLQPLGKWSGVACESVVMGVRAPEAIIAQMLLCDGDGSRQFRQYLLHPDITVGGFGLAEHPQHGSAGTLTLLSLFATALTEAHVVECDSGRVSEEFLQVLDAIPSAQLREMAQNALAAGKKAKLDYQVAPKTAAELTIYESDGDAATTRIEW